MSNEKKSEGAALFVVLKPGEKTMLEHPEWNVPAETRDAGDDIAIPFGPVSPDRGDPRG